MEEETGEGNVEGLRLYLFGGRGPVARWVKFGIEECQRAGGKAGLK